MELEDLVSHPLFGDIIAKHLARLAENQTLPALRHFVTDIQEDLLERAMYLCDGNKAAASRLIGMNRTTLLETFKKKSFKTRRVRRWANIDCVKEKRSYRIDDCLTSIS